MGRKAIAAEVKEATGAFRKDPQRRNSSAPKADGQSPVMPDNLCEVAQAKWVELSADLQRNGVLSTDAREIMIAYCTTFARWQAACEKVDETGLAIESVDKYGNTVISRNAYVSEMHKCREQLNKLLPEFGLTPASRQKLTSMNLDDKKENPLTNYFNQMARG